MKRKRVLSIILTLAILMSVIVSFPAEAASKTVTTNITSKTNIDVIPTVTKGTTKVNVKKHGAIIKFTAKETKTYTFTFSNLATVKDCIFDIRKTNNDRVAQANLCQKKYESEYKWSGFQVKDARSFKLKKGETILIYNYPYPAKAFTYTLSIK